MQIPELKVPMFDPASGIVIYGAGRTGKFVLQQCSNAGIPVRAMIDRNPGNGSNGVAFFQFPDVPAELKSLPTVVAVHGEVLNAWSSLVDAGFTNMYTMSQFYLLLEHKYGRKLPNYACLGNSCGMDQAQNEILSAYDLWEDEISRQNFLNQLQYRRNGDIQYIQAPDPGLEYYPLNRPFQFCCPVNFIDCGAFTGDTIGELVKEMEFESIAAFEPDPETFKLLRDFLAVKKIPGKILTIQAGVGESNQILSFSSAQDGSAFGSGELNIPVFSLDSLFFAYRVDFIKMDIEGSESAALKGAAELIKRENPVLAISVYHKPEDLWELPLLIKKLYPASHLFLRTPRGSYHDTVCYAVPDRFLK
ncbi:MAG: FkbM family methyltransferase [Victivallales bacterium]|jgi:FkbM family methyltransferase|nr:FkbM family methyltransferase [Victivallales bacterium]